MRSLVSKSPPNTLFAWIGKTDHRAARENIQPLSKDKDIGPVARTLLERFFERVCLINDAPKEDGDIYQRWLCEGLSAPLPNIRILNVHLEKGPTELAELYACSMKAIQSRDLAGDPQPRLAYLLSSGTSAMQAIWIFLSLGSHPAELIESSVERGVITKDIPYRAAVEFSPIYQESSDWEEKYRQLEHSKRERYDNAFSHIIGQSPAIRNTIKLTMMLCDRGNSTILLLGETGTGKTDFAKGISKASGAKKFIKVDCPSIPEGHFESHIFGHEKGSFTGAINKRVGYLEEAEDGILFLDELGELPLSQQVKLLNVVQDREYRRLGGSKPIPVRCRIIAATNQKLDEMISQHKFRDDLYYRLGVLKIEIPPLRKREGDTKILIDYFVDICNQKYSGKDFYEPKVISPEAYHLLIHYHWPANVRELNDVIDFVCASSLHTYITDEDVEAAISKQLTPKTDILNQPLGNGFSIQSLLEEVERHYIERAIKENVGKTMDEIGDMLGYKSPRQTLSDRIEQYDIQFNPGRKKTSKKKNS